MKTFKVELSPKVESSGLPHHLFETVAECIDMDDCIEFKKVMRQSRTFNLGREFNFECFH